METQTISGTAVDALFAAQQQTAVRLKNSTATERIARIVKLKNVIFILSRLMQRHSVIARWAGCILWTQSGRTGDDDGVSLWA